MSLAQAKQAARRKQKEFDVKPVGGYTLKDAFVLWCNLKRGRIVSYKDEKKRIEFYLMRHLGNRQLDEITAPLVIKTVQVIERDGKQSTLKRILMRLREIMELAVCAGYIDANPLHRVSRVFAPAKSTAMPSVDWRDDSTKTGEISISGAEKSVRKLPFNASNSNAKYNGATLQPNAILALACIRI